MSLRLCAISPERGVSSNVGLLVLVFLFLLIAAGVVGVDWVMDVGIEAEIDDGFEVEPALESELVVDWRMLCERVRSWRRDPGFGLVLRLRLRLELELVLVLIVRRLLADAYAFSFAVLEDMLRFNTDLAFLPTYKY